MSTRIVWNRGETGRQCVSLVARAENFHARLLRPTLEFELGPLVGRVGLSAHFLFAVALLALPFTLPDSELLVAGLLTVGVLLVSVTLHEVAHALAAMRVGGKVDAIVLGPVGGLISPRVPDEPEIHLFVALAGPIVHLLLAVLAAIVLAIAGNTRAVGSFEPAGDADETWWSRAACWLVAAKLTLWLNWILMLLNLLPAYPVRRRAGAPGDALAGTRPANARIVTARVAMGVAVAALLPRRC